MLIVSLEGDIQNSNIICSQQFEAVGFLKVVCGIVVHFQVRLSAVSFRVPGYPIPPQKSVQSRPLLGEASAGRWAFRGEFVQSPSTHRIRALEQ